MFAGAVRGLGLGLRLCPDCSEIIQVQNHQGTILQGKGSICSGAATIIDRDAAGELLLMRDPARLLLGGSSPWGKPGGYYIIDNGCHQWAVRDCRLQPNA